MGEKRWKRGGCWLQEGRERIWGWVCLLHVTRGEEPLPEGEERSGWKVEWWLLGRFKGSTLEVMGIVIEQGEWAIVGGTGQFAMANGVILKKFHEQKNKGNIMELTIKGFCPVLKGSPSQCLVTKIGPWGGIDGGRAQDIIATPKRLESITIHSGCTVDSISFIYFDQAGEKHRAGPWGGPGGDPCTIEFGNSEFLKEVSGTFGPYEGCKVIRSIKFVTNKKTYGPFG